MVRMKFVLIASAIIFQASSALYSQTDSTEKLPIRFFGSSTCGECLEIKEAILKPLSKKYPDRLKLEIYDIEDKASYQLLLKLEKEYGVKQSSPQELFLPDTFLTGYQSIIDHGESLIISSMSRRIKLPSNPLEVDTAAYTKALRERFEQFTFLGITAAGMVDGVNPCAIATMIFLISFLATQKRKRSEILTIGLSFTAAVYLTYLLLGIGAFKAIVMLDQYRWVSLLIRWSAVAAAAVIGIISFWDAFAYRRSGSADDIKLQLPKTVKLQIHKVISGNLKESQLIWGAVITGFLVTLLEAVCTGQVYLPTIVLMTRAKGLRITGWLYLLYYNFLFVLPLLIVMIMAYFGLTWNRLAKTTQTHLALLKILLGVVMIGLALFLALA